MKITSQEEYGVRCLMRLARAHGGQPLTIPEIASAEGMSAPYVGKLLAVLKAAGLVESVRGRLGGYRLSRPPDEVRLGTALLALGEPLFDEPGYCERHAADGVLCANHDGCTLRGLWGALERWMRHVLDGVTLADLLRRDGAALDRLRARLPAGDEGLLKLVVLEGGR